MKGSSAPQLADLYSLSVELFWLNKFIAKHGIRRTASVARHPSVNAFHTMSRTGQTWNSYGGWGTGGGHWAPASGGGG